MGVHWQSRSYFRNPNLSAEERRHVYRLNENFKFHNFVQLHARRRRVHHFVNHFMADDDREWREDQPDEQQELLFAPKGVTHTFYLHRSIRQQGARDALTEKIQVFLFLFEFWTASLNFALGQWRGDH